MKKWLWALLALLVLLVVVVLFVHYRGKAASVKKEIPPVVKPVAKPDKKVIRYGGKVELDKADGQYKSGETVTCFITLTNDDQPLKGTKARLQLRWEGKTVKTQVFETTGEPVKFTYKSDKPGWVYFGFEVLDEKGKSLRGNGVQRHRMKPTIVTEIGAIFDGDRIRTGVKRPADFEEFWAKRRAELDKLPIKPVLKELRSGDKKVKLYAVEVPTLDEYPVTGYLGIPADAKPKSLPACLNWASWSASDASRSAAVNKAKEGYICFSTSWHGRPVNKGAKWYDYKTTIKIDGGLKGIHDRDKWCFSGMYYRIMRALDYVKTLPEWDGKNLISQGGSLGGAQSLAAAALDKDITLAIVQVPCFCEFDGAASGHKSSIPMGKPPIVNEIANGDRRALDATAYFDGVNFAPMVKCEIFMCTGGTDELCPPSNIYAAYNALPQDTKKGFFFNPKTGHYGQIGASVAPHIRKLFSSIKVNNYDVK